MSIRNLALGSALVLVGYVLGTHSASPAAQQTFLPPDFQVSAVLTLDNNNNEVRYSVLAQQGAWIRVKVENPAAARPTDDKTWIYAPNGTTWTRVK